MKILFMHQTIATYDAIGNDIRGMYDALSKNNECFVYCEYYKTQGYERLSKMEVEEFLSCPDNTVIYNHSGYWENGEILLLQAKAKIIIRYHNVTPAHFFKKYSEFYIEQCEKGREQTLRLMELFPEALWLSDSKYNASELTMIPKERQSILPPFHQLQVFDGIKADENVLQEIKATEGVKILFTGRIAPNKGHLSWISMIKNYKENYGPVHGYIVGKFDDSLQGYTKELKCEILALGLENDISFIGEINDASLLAYYQGCDYYVSFSDHEGFGVPFIEAQYLKLPVIAKDRAAAGEVLGENQLLLDEDVNLYSSAIAYLQGHPEVRQELIDIGYKNCVERFNIEKMSDMLENYISEIL